MDSVYIFEGCYIGMQLPISAQAQVQNHQPWSVPPGGPTGDGKPGSWGGHAVPGALSIAFDTTIVGALALPWVLLVVHLFFFGGENRLGDFLKWVKEQDQAAAVGVVLFAVAVPLQDTAESPAVDPIGMIAGLTQYSIFRLHHHLFSAHVVILVSPSLIMVRAARWVQRNLGR